MGSDPYNPDYDYIAYVDEAGDPGLKNLRPDSPTGSSEWFVLSALLISKKYEMEIRDWTAAMIKATGRHQRKDLHFRDLHDAHKNLVCTMLANHPVRCFAVCSHKKSLLNWRKPALEQMNNQDWFYSFLTRYLLERVTQFVADNSQATFNETRKVKIVFSERGGLNVGQMSAYYDILSNQSRGGRLFLRRGDLAWGTFHRLLLKRARSKVSAGLQLSDIVASSFFRACDQYNTLDCNPSFARLLKPRMARVPDKPKGKISGFGLKVAPKYEPMNWLPIQGEIFAHYGYPSEWWAPVPTTPPYFE